MTHVQDIGETGVLGMTVITHGHTKMDKKTLLALPYGLRLGDTKRHPSRGKWLWLWRGVWV